MSGGLSGGLGTRGTPGLTPTADDPLGVRPDFPVTGELTYLDGAYITPSPRQAVDAAQAFLEAKARNPISLGGMLGETVSVRQKFARLVGATEAEIAEVHSGWERRLSEADAGFSSRFPAKW